MLGCSCPAPAALLSIPKFDCKENLGQIQKIVFQRRGYQFPKNATTGEATIIYKANWDALKTAVNDTKIITSPFVEGFSIPSGEPITEGGGDNSTLDGAEIVLGAGSIGSEGFFRSIPSHVAAALQALNCEGDLTVYMVNEYGQLIAEEVGAAGSNIYRGFPVNFVWVGDPSNEGKNTHDKTPIRMNFIAGWRKKLKLLKPVDFDAKYDLN